MVNDHETQQVHSAFRGVGYFFRFGSRDRLRLAGAISGPFEVAVGHFLRGHESSPDLELHEQSIRRVNSENNLFGDLLLLDFYLPGSILHGMMSPLPKWRRPPGLLVFLTPIMKSSMCSVFMPDLESICMAKKCKRILPRFGD
jgi:hypothetical protein